MSGFRPNDAAVITEPVDSHLLATIYQRTWPDTQGVLVDLTDERRMQDLTNLIGEQPNVVMNRDRRRRTQ